MRRTPPDGNSAAAAIPLNAAFHRSREVPAAWSESGFRVFSHSTRAQRWMRNPLLYPLSYGGTVPIVDARGAVLAGDAGSLDAGGATLRPLGFRIHAPC